MVPAHWVASNLPISVEPVKLSLRTAGWAVSSPPMAPALPVMQWMAPAGTPASSAKWTRANADKGV